MPYDDTVAAVMSMYDDMGFIQKYRIKKEPLAKYDLKHILFLMWERAKAHPGNTGPRSMLQNASALIFTVTCNFILVM